MNPMQHSSASAPRHVRAWGSVVIAATALAGSLAIHASAGGGDGRHRAHATLVAGPRYAEQQRKKAAAEKARRSDVEGAIWQYKATIAESKERRTGQFRIKGTAIFEKSKRVGDVIKKSDKTQLVFNEIKDLKGRALISEERPGFWKGYYEDEKQRRWKFELRRGED